MAKTERSTTVTGTKQGEKRHTIYASVEDISKMKFIAWEERRKAERSVFDEAITQFIERWEKKNGAITPAMIKKMEDSK